MKREMKIQRPMIVALAVTITFAALLVVPTRQVRAVPPIHCDGGPGVLCKDGHVDFCPNSPCSCCGGPCPAGQICSLPPENREKQRLLVAYAAQRQPSPPNSPNQQSQETRLRRASAMGLSWLMLLVGLVGLVRLLRTLMVPQRTPAHRWKRALAVSTAVALVGAVLVIGASVEPTRPLARTPGPPAGEPGSSPAVRGAAFPSPLGIPRFTSAFLIGGTGTTQIGGTGIDPLGNLYVTGGFSGTITFNTNPPTTLTSTARDDVFVAKYDPSGRPLWARVANGAPGLRRTLSLGGGLALAVDTQGNCYVGGSFVKTLSFKDANNQTVATLTDSGPGLNFEPFVAKYDTQGTLRWVRGGQTGSPQAANNLNRGLNSITDIVVDGAGNPYVGGSFSGTTFLGTAVSVAGKIDAMVARLNPMTGAPVWVSVTGGRADDSVDGVAVDNAANIYVIGNIQGPATFPTQPRPTRLLNADRTTTFIAKYNQTGQLLWVKDISGEREVVGRSIAVNGAGEIYVTGFFYATAFFDEVTLIDAPPDPNNPDEVNPQDPDVANPDSDSEDAPDRGFAEPFGLVSGYLAKLNTDGKVMWADEFFNAKGERVTLDGAGNPYITGIFIGDADWGTDNGGPLDSEGGEDQYIAKYNAAGRFLWAKALAGSGADSRSVIESSDVQATTVPVRLVYNRVTGAMHVSGDLRGRLGLDRLTLRTPLHDRHGFVATLQP